MDLINAGNQARFFVDIWTDGFPEKISMCDTRSRRALVPRHWDVIGRGRPYSRLQTFCSFEW